MPFPSLKELVDTDADSIMKFLFSDDFEPLILEEDEAEFDEYIQKKFENIAIDDRITALYKMMDDMEEYVRNKPVEFIDHVAPALVNTNQIHGSNRAFHRENPKEYKRMWYRVNKKRNKARSSMHAHLNKLSNHTTNSAKGCHICKFNRECITEINSLQYQRHCID